eukprot:Stramenopile-MAST_4_protein_528
MKTGCFVFAVVWWSFCAPPLVRGDGEKDPSLMDQFIQSAGNDRNSAVQFLKTHPQLVQWKLYMEQNSTSAFHEASKRGHTHVVLLLLEMGAPLDSRDEFGRTAIHYAALCSKQHVVRHGICPEETGYLGESDDSHVKTMDILLSSGSSPPVEAVDNDGRTALMYAAMQGHSDVVEVLLKHGTDSAHRDLSGWSALFFAALYDHPNVLRILLENPKTESDVPDSMGYTALVIAAEQGWKDNVLLLLSYGADPSRLCRDGKPPSVHARAKGHEEVAKILEAAVEKSTSL